MDKTLKLLLALLVVVAYFAGLVSGRRIERTRVEPRTDTLTVVVPVDCTSLVSRAPDSRFVVLGEHIPDLIQEIRYYSTFNFIGTRVEGYEMPVALLTREAADSLKKVSDDVIALGYRLKIYDAYRPARGVKHFLRWSTFPADTVTKQYFYPEHPKPSLFSKGYVAERSGHSRGSTVDLTLLDMKTGRDLDMGGNYDYLGGRSHPSFRGDLTPEQLENRMILRRAMLSHGFKPLETEWWHFTLGNEPYPSTYFDFPVRIEY
jgi:D-alanyl-D-alanine dipeptidase